MGKGTKKHQVRSVQMTQTMKKISAIKIDSTGELGDMYISWCPKCRKEMSFNSEPESTMIMGCACGFRYCVIIEKETDYE